jgi:hypothetical protein
MQKVKNKNTSHPPQDGFHNFENRTEARKDRRILQLLTSAIKVHISKQNH